MAQYFGSTYSSAASSPVQGRTAGLMVPRPQPQAQPAAPPMSTPDPRQGTRQVTTLQTRTPQAAPTASGYTEMRGQDIAYNSPWDPGMTQGVNRNIINLLSQDPNNVSRNDSDIAPIIQANDAVTQRQARMARDAAAERAAAEGTLEGGNFSAEVRRIQDAARQEQAGFEAGIMRDGLNERRQRMMQALQIGSGLIDSDTERKLKTDLANQDNRFKYDDMNSRNKLGWADLDLRGELGRGDLDVRRQDLGLRRELGMGDLDIRRRGLDQDQRQFDDRLGFDKQRDARDYNSRIAQYLMGL